MRKVLLATVSAMTLSLGTAWADEALVVESDADSVSEASVDTADSAVLIENAFGHGMYDAQEIISANLVDDQGQNIADPIDLLIDSDENVAFVITYIAGDLIAVPTEQLEAHRRGDMLVLSTEHTRAELAAMGNFDLSQHDYRLYSEDVYNMSGLSAADAETTSD